MSWRPADPNWRTTLNGKRVAVIGAAATGRGAAPVLASLGASVVVYDERGPEELAVIRDELDGNCELRLGDSSYPGIEACDLIVPSPGVPADSPVLQRLQALGVPILSEIEVAYRIARAPILAVTGTNGKTTTVLMLLSILRAAGREATCAGNTLAGGHQMPLIRAAHTASADAWLVSEVSSFQLEWVQLFRPRVSVITNVTADHLNRHHTVEAYVDTKARLLAAQGEGDTAILNLQNHACRRLLERVRCARLAFSRDPDDGADLWAEVVSGARLLRIRSGGEAHDLCDASVLRVPGEHTIENALAAAGAAWSVGCTADEIRRGLANFEGVPDRLEEVGTWNGVTFVNNTMCTNVDAAVRSIEAYSRPVVLIAGGKDKGLDFRPLGQTIASRVKALVSIGADGPRIADAAREFGFSHIRNAISMGDAVRLAAELSVPGDVVLLAPACASFDWYRSFEARGKDFTQEVLSLCNGLHGDKP